MTYKILVTDGAHKNTLAILRALGKADEKYEIEVVSPFKKLFTICAYSKYCKKIHTIPINDWDLESYAKSLLDLVSTQKYDVLLPVGLKSYLVTSRYENYFKNHVGLVVPEWEKMKLAYNKDQTMNLAKQIGIPIPETIKLVSEHDFENIISFPVVIKSSDGYLRYCKNIDEVKNYFKLFKTKSKTTIIAQEYIRGFGCGYFGIYYKGKVFAYFLHKRIKEFPVTGGPSAVAESYFDEKLHYYGEKICKKLNWNGPIMVEFKYDIDKDEYKLIEINPKLWGSLDLTIESGINVPELLIKLALKEHIDPISTYNHVKYRWVFPDEFKVLISEPSIVNFKEFLYFGDDVKTNLFFGDPMPTLYQIVRGLLEGLLIIIDKKLKYPQGKI